MTDFNPYPCQTKLQRDRSLQLVTQLHACAFNLLIGIHAGRTILVNDDFERQLTDMVCRYEEEIHRLKSVKFTNRGVVEI